MVTHSASWKYQSENLNYRLQYQAKYQATESLRLHYSDTVVSMVRKMPENLRLCRPLYSQNKRL